MEGFTKKMSKETSEHYWPVIIGLSNILKPNLQICDAYLLPDDLMVLEVSRMFVRV